MSWFNLGILFTHLFLPITKWEENIPDSYSKDSVFLVHRSNSSQATRYGPQVKYSLESFFEVQLLDPSICEHNRLPCCLLVNSFVTVSRRMVSYGDLQHYSYGLYQIMPSLSSLKWLQVFYQVIFKLWVFLGNAFKSLGPNILWWTALDKGWHWQLHFKM